MATSIGDIITIGEPLRSVSLSQLSALRKDLDQQSTGLSLPVSSQLQQLLGDYVAEGDEAEAALRRILTAVTQYDSNQGAAILVQGPPRSGKSHLLTAVTLLLEYPMAWSAFLENHPQFQDLQQRVPPQSGPLVVPVPLDEHRGDQEHLEDILFQRTEQELARTKYDLAVPLSPRSYSMDLIQRHMIPRYGTQLNEKARQYPGGYTTFGQLKQNHPDEAVSIARQLARQLGYPLDFRQSRTERLSRLSQIVADQDFRGVVWVVDDLSGFLASVDSKAVHNDCGFLEFLGQRSKIEPLYLVVALEESLEQFAGLEPYLLGSLQTLYTTIRLPAAQMRKVAMQRLASSPQDRQNIQQAVAQAYEAYQDAFGEPTFTLPELVDTYPLHPLAIQSLETTVQRYLGTADGLIRLVTAPANQGGLNNYRERDCCRLVGPVEIVPFLRSLLDSHPQAAPYFTEIEDFYQRNISQVVPEDPDLGLDLIRCLIVLRLGNVSASANIIAESLGLTEEGNPRANPERVRQLLETMRVMGSYVDVRRGPDPASSVYLVDASTNLTELMRRRLNAVKATLADDDPRLWRRIVTCNDSPNFPLAELTRSQLQEVLWNNSHRTVRIETANLATLTTAQLAAYVVELGDPATAEDCRLFVAELLRPQPQMSAWPPAQSSALHSRWAAGLIAWLPRALTPQEVDVVKQCVACHALLHQPAPEPELQAAWRSRLLEERMTVDNQVRQITQQAYYEGQIATLTGEAVGVEELNVAKGDWAATLSAASRPALLALFPDFPPIAPRRPITSQEQVDKLVSQVIAAAPLESEPESNLRELCDAFLVPLGLVTYENNTIQLQVANSTVAKEIMRLIRQRDQTPQHKQGRALSCPDLAQHLLKSPLGLSPQLFELAVAVLVRLGYLVALDESGQPLRFRDIELPFSSKVQFIARPPLLPLSTWQVLSRLARILLKTGIPGPDYAVQQHIWEQLLLERERQLNRLQRLQEQLEEVWHSLGQAPEKWQQSVTDVNDAVEFFEMIDPHKHSAAGLDELLSRLEPYMTENHGPRLLTALLQRIDDLGDFLTEVASALTAVKQYIDSVELGVAADPDLEKRAQSLAELIDSGEEVIGQQLAFRRYLQRFLTTYKRKYLTWHNQVYGNPIFEQYRSVQSTAEYRALAQLEKIDMEVEHNAGHVAELINDCVAQRCRYPDLAMALDRHPVCPSCQLVLGKAPQLPSVDSLKAAIGQGLEEYAQVLCQPQFQQQLLTYAAVLPHRGDIPEKISNIAQLSVPPTPKQILTLFTDDVVGHINRVLVGKTLVPRDFRELRDALAGRALTKKEAQQLFKTWLEGTQGPLDDEEILDIEE